MGLGFSDLALGFRDCGLWISVLGSSMSLYGTTKNEHENQQGQSINFHNMEITKNDKKKSSKTSINLKPPPY